MVAVALVAIVHTWTLFPQTVDEPAHIAAGVEWLDTGRYTLDPQHPPLARILIGIGPMLRGAAYEVRKNWMVAGNAVLYGNGNYLATLASARAGTLPFFLVACVVVFAWTLELYGRSAALVALLFFATQPTVVAHAALATTDMAAAGTILAALYAFHRWLGNSSHLNAVVLGLAAGAALASKFSAIAFLPAAFAAMLIVVRPRKMSSSSLLALVVAALTLAAVYRMQSGLLAGIGELRAHNRSGHPAYLLGEIRSDGWWIYFPIALWFKSTLALLGGFAFGAFLLVRRRSASLVPLVVIAAILIVAMLSRISIGVRHVLPLYPLLAMVAAYGVVSLRRPLQIALIAAQLAAFVLAHPDHLSYFNITAGREPSRILLDSNLDWGQDLLRLEEATARREIDRLHIALFTSADLTRHRLPHLQPLRPETPVQGWVAISEMQLKMRSGYEWLHAHQPVERIGTSILLYRIE